MLENHGCVVGFGKNSPNMTINRLKMRKIHHTNANLKQNDTATLRRVENLKIRGLKIRDENSPHLRVSPKVISWVPPPTGGTFKQDSPRSKIFSFARFLKSNHLRKPDS